MTLINDRSHCVAAPLIQCLLSRRVPASMVEADVLWEFVSATGIFINETVCGGGGQKGQAVCTGDQDSEL